MASISPLRSRLLAIAPIAGLLLATALVAFTGCSRPFYRKQADREAYFLIRQKLNDPRWCLQDFRIDIDPHSRFYDETDPDYSPLPKDDPFSHKYMVCVDGMKGWPCWACNGYHCDVENPRWRNMLPDYVDLTNDGALKLNVESSVHISRLNDPDYQQQLETLYLSALDVSAERFRFTTQFFGDTETVFTHKGQAVPPLGETNILEQDQNAQIKKHFATGADLLIGFANSIVWQFAGPNSNSTVSLLNFSFMQPLLRSGGRAFALEQLTIVERALLANVRAMERYRQGFYTNVVIGDLNVVGPQRRGGFFGGTGLTGFTGQGTGGFGVVGQLTGFGSGNAGNVGAVGNGGGTAAGFAGGGAGTLNGFIGLLQQLQQVRNFRSNLTAEIRTLGLLEANLAAGLIDIAQVDQFRQVIETDRANLLQAQNTLLNTLDNYKVQTLGFPPDVKIALDDGMIRQFQIIDPQTTIAQNKVEDFIDLLGELPLTPSEQELTAATDTLVDLTRAINSVFGMVRDDLKAMDAARPQRETNMTPDELKRYASEREKLIAGFQEIDEHRQNLLDEIRKFTTEYQQQPTAGAADKLVSLATTLLGITQEASLVEARARVETITLDRLVLTPHQAIAIARANRLDWMNNRAALVDTWRLIVFNANQLQAGLQVTLNGDLGTVGNNPVNFNGTAGTLSAGLRFDAPFTRLLERNNYRSALISYQQARRQLILYQDTVYQTLRRGLRQLDQLDKNLEIQRRAIVIAVRRVDQTREVLSKPPDLVQPGMAAAQLGPTSAQNLLTALADLRNTQNNLMSVWLNYYATRMVMMRELGVMEIDPSGLWIDRPISEAVAMEESECPLPPPLPRELIQSLGLAPSLTDGRVQPGLEQVPKPGEQSETDNEFD